MALYNMIGESLNIQNASLEKLKQLFPEIFSENKLDWEKLKAVFNDDINFANERYVLNWAGKAEAFKALQIPTTATLKPVPEESINFDTTQNVFIEGENLEVLKVLQKSYYGKVKCIIIDPPYNTGSDNFIYPDSFKENKRDYEKRVGDKDEEGYLLKEGLFRKNSKDSGHFHSNWLSMMYPRLFLAKNLLRDDGVIFVHIDDNEVHNLRLLMNEIFGEENFINTIIWEKKFSPQNDARYFSDNHDYILAFSKIKEQFKRNLLPKTEELLNRYSNPDNDYRHEWTSSDCTVKTYSASYDYEIISPSGKSIFPTKGRCWFTSKEKFQELINDNRIWFGKNGDNVPRLKSFLSEVKDGIVPTTIWKHTDVGHNQEAKQEINKLFDGQSPFETPKPTRLIKRIIELSTNNDSVDIILDFFAGSATTAHSVILKNEEDEGNRKFILVQLPELIDEKSENNKLGYKTIADISKERIRRAIKQSENPVKKIETNSKNEKSQLGLDLGTDHLSATVTTTIRETTELRFKENTIHVQDLGFKVFKLSASNFKIWQGDGVNEENLVYQLDAFTNPVNEDSLLINMLYELLVKAGYSLTEKIDVIDNYFSVNDGELIIALQEINQVVVDKIILSKPKKVITLDSLFKHNDQLKTNTVLQMRHGGIDFKTI